MEVHELSCAPSNPDRVIPHLSQKKKNNCLHLRYFSINMTLWLGNTLHNSLFIFQRLTWIRQKQKAAKVNFGKHDLKLLLSGSIKGGCGGINV